MRFKDILTTWKKVFSNWKYPLSAILVALIFYSFNVAVNNWSSLKSFFYSVGFFGGLEFFFVLAWGFGNTIETHSFISLIIVSILSGILFSLVAYKASAGNSVKSKKMGVFGTTGVFLAALAPGCAACGVGLISAFGLSAAFLTFFPLNGLELSILAIGILTFSVYKITNDMSFCQKCQVKLNNNNLKGGK